MSADDLIRDEAYDEDEDTLSNKYLTFCLGKEDYGIEIKYVTEIVVVQKITEVPDMPGYVQGVINLRGQVIPVMDIRLRFNMEFREYDERTCVIVVNLEDMYVGLIVDTVQEVCEILPDNVSPAPSLGNSEKNRYILGMGKIGPDVKILLDVNLLIQEDELVMLEEAAS